jgi:hypothetical protein
LDQLFTMPGLGSRKPSAMLTAMLELCPRGEENTCTFAGVVWRPCERPRLEY